MDKTAIVIGAGIGGLAVAIRMAREGWKVKVFEKNSRVGGKMDCYTNNDFIWDVGPSTIIMPFVLRELFDYAGHDLEDYLELVEVDPMTRYFFPDGKVLNAWSNFHHFQIEVARQEKDHGEALEGYMRFSQALYEVTGEPNLFPPSDSLSKFKRGTLKRWTRFPKMMWSKNMSAVIEKYFKDPRIRQIFLSYAAQRGCSPYQAPAALNLIPYLETQSGSWYIRGGSFRLAEALEKCAKDLGVDIMLNAEISEILTQEEGKLRKPRITGVSLRHGIRQEAPVVICNADYVHSWSRLIHHKKQAGLFKRLERKVYSTSSLIVLWGVKRRYEKLAHHNLFFSSDYPNEYKEIFQKRKIPDDFSIQLVVSSRTDPTQAPKNQDNYLVKVQVPSLEPDHHWEEIRDSFKDKILDRLEKAGLERLRDEIVCEKVVTPADLATRSNAYRGACYGQATHGRSMWIQPENRSVEIEGLYFVGGTIRPGGGVPFVLLSAQGVCRQLKQDYNTD